MVSPRPPTRRPSTSRRGSAARRWSRSEASWPSGGRRRGPGFRRRGERRPPAALAVEREGLASPAAVEDQAVGVRIVTGCPARDVAARVGGDDAALAVGDRDRLERHSAVRLRRQVEDLAAVRRESLRAEARVSRIGQEEAHLAARAVGDEQLVGLGVDGVQHGDRLSARRHRDRREAEVVAPQLAARVTAAGEFEHVGRSRQTLVDRDPEALAATGESEPAQGTGRARRQLAPGAGQLAHEEALRGAGGRPPCHQPTRIGREARDPGGLTSRTGRRDRLGSQRVALEANPEQRPIGRLRGPGRAAGERRESRRRSRSEELLGRVAQRGDRRRQFGRRRRSRSAAGVGEERREQQDRGSRTRSRPHRAGAVSRFGSGAHRAGTIPRLRLDSPHDGAQVRSQGVSRRRQDRRARAARRPAGFPSGAAARA